MTGRAPTAEQWEALRERLSVAMAYAEAHPECVRNIDAREDWLQRECILPDGNVFQWWARGDEYTNLTIMRPTETPE